MIANHRAPLIVPDDPATGLQVCHRSAELEILSGPSDEIRPVVEGLLSSENDADIRYFLSAGADDFHRPAWAFGANHSTGSHATERTVTRATPPGGFDPAGRIGIESVLYGRDAHERAMIDAISATGLWLGDPGPRRLVLESIGPWSPDDLAFLRGCRLRLPRRTWERSPILVLRHEQSRHLMRPDHKSAAILLALLFSGGYARTADFDRWAGHADWDPGLVERLTSKRGAYTTYLGAAQRAQARIAYQQASPATLGENAAMVVAAGRSAVLPACAAHVSDAATALSAMSEEGCAQASGNASVLSYGKNIFRNARRHSWQGVSKAAAGALVLAGIVARKSRVSRGEANAVLRLAEWFGVEDEIRSLFAYVLGQALAKDPDADRRVASPAYFDYVRSCSRSASDNPEAIASRVAAAHNGAALAYFAIGDEVRAVEAEQSALEALKTQEVEGLYEQEVLLLTNQAKVHRRRGDIWRALDCYRAGWKLADSKRSLAGLAYASPDLVRSLISAHRLKEAERVTTTLLQSFDATPFPSRDKERAVVTCCFALADLHMGTGNATIAVRWYIDAVRRMHRGVPAVIEGILENLAGAPMPASPTDLDFLRSEQTAHQAAAVDLDALLFLAKGGE